MKKPYRPPKIVDIGSICRKEDFICIDDIKIGKLVQRDGKNYLQLKDKDPRRSRERGTEFVEILIVDLGKIEFCEDDVIDK